MEAYWQKYESMEEFSCQENCGFFAVVSDFGAPIYQDVFLDPEFFEKNKNTVEDNRRVYRHEEERKGHCFHRVGVGIGDEPVQLLVDPHGLPLGVIRLYCFSFGKFVDQVHLEFFLQLKSFQEELLKGSNPEVGNEDSIDSGYEASVSEEVEVYETNEERDDGICAKLGLRYQNFGFLPSRGTLLLLAPLERQKAAFGIVLESSLLSPQIYQEL